MPSPPVGPALPSPSPASEPGKAMPVGCGRPLSARFAKLGPAGSWERTSGAFSQLTLGGSLETFSATWPASGSLRNGACFERPPLARPIAESEFSSWPTVEADNFDKPVTESSYRPSIGHSARTWKTPHGFANTDKGGKTAGASGEFGKQVQAWPTPRAGEEKGGQYQRDRGAKDGTERPTLTGEAQLWPTPQSVPEAETSHGQVSGDFRRRMGEAMESLWPTPDGLAKERENRSVSPGAAVRPTLAKAGSLWATPAARDGDPKRGGQELKHTDGGRSLPADLEAWPSPGADDCKGSAEEGQRRRQLSEAAECLWSTPRSGKTTSEGEAWNERNEAGGVSTPPFAIQAEGFPTSLPAPATEPPGPASSSSAPTSPPPSLEKKRLNWRFVAWLMGFRPEWLLLPRTSPDPSPLPASMPSAPSGTPSSRRKPRRPSKSSTGESSNEKK